MKKIFLIASGILFCTIILKAQTIKDLFESKDVAIYWLGIDFSHVKLIGYFEGNTPTEIRDVYFPAWNRLVLDESRKYDIVGMLHKETIGFDTAGINFINAHARVNNMVAFSDPLYTDEMICQAVKNFTYSNPTGIGIAFVAEYLDKDRLRGVFRFVAVNMSTNEVLLQKSMYGKPWGMGLRNFWAGSLYEIISDIQKSDYLRWKQKYLK